MSNRTTVTSARLAGKEDLYLGSGSSSFIDGGGNMRVLTAINAETIPVLADVSSATGAGDVNGAILALSNELGGVSVLSDDTEVSFGSMTATERQTAINSAPKNLGGHTLTFVFLESTDIASNAVMRYEGFYNGKVVVDFNGILYEDASVLDSLVQVVNCHCSVVLKNGTLKHTKGDTGLYVSGSYDVLQNNLVYSGLSGGTNYCAARYVNGDGYQSGCSFVNDSQYKFADDKYNDLAGRINSAGITSSAVSSMISAHNDSTGAHGISASIESHNVNTNAHSATISANVSSAVSGLLADHNANISAHSAAIAQQVSQIVSGGLMIQLEEAIGFEGFATLSGLVSSTYISSGSSSVSSGLTQDFSSRSYMRLYKHVVTSGGTSTPICFMKCGGVALADPTSGYTINFSDTFGKQFTRQGPFSVHATPFGAPYDYMDTERNITSSGFHEDASQDTNYCCVIESIYRDHITVKVRDTDQVQGRCCMFSWSAEGYYDPQLADHTDITHPVSSGSN